MNPIVDAFMKKVAGHIESSGRAVVSVEGELGAAEGYPIAYSVGHAERHLPELVLTTITGDLATNLINEVAAALDAQGWADADGRAIRLRSVMVRIVGTGSFGRQAKVANHRAGLMDITAISFLQILWPDKEDRFPGDPEYDHMRYPQPLLREQKDVPAVN